MQNQVTELECIKMMLAACERECTELAAGVSQGKATLAALAEAEWQRGRWLALATFVEERRFVPARAGAALQRRHCRACRR